MCQRGAVVMRVDQGPGFEVLASNAVEIGPVSLNVVLIQSLDYWPAFIDRFLGSPGLIEVLKQSFAEEELENKMLDVLVGSS